MTRDFLYENAPLIEVIAEVRWEVVPVATAPEAAIDPNFEATSSAFIEKCKHRGFVLIERLVPPDMPLELVPRRPVYRIRKEKNEWPLYQIGPGLFTCNIVPVYQGWPSFRDFLGAGIAELMDSFPMPAQYIKFSSLQLRYIDGFVEKHGLKDINSFSRDCLGVDVSLRSEILKKHAHEDPELSVNAAISFRALSPKRAMARLKIDPGEINSESGLILDMHVMSNPQDSISPTSEYMMTWMDEAHETISSMFESMTSDALKEAMGPRNFI